jgi:hypothetical protein
MWVGSYEKRIILLNMFCNDVKMGLRVVISTTKGRGILGI